MKQKIMIGIDTGTNTGFAVFNCEKRKFILIETLSIHNALFAVFHYRQHPRFEIKKVRVEDARLRTWFGNSGIEKLQGAGSIKRDAKIWEDFLTEYNIPFEMVKPSAGATKWKADTFKSSFNWNGKTTNHSRDAALLVAQ